MACSSKEEKYGYEDYRFEKDVDEHFHCSICYNVLKDARMCRNNEHVFCLACISEHLKVNSQTCPECSEHLSVDTLRRPRVLNNYLSKLKINCDYASRGCPEYICVEEVDAHVAKCGFASVLCSNENCGMEINRQEREHHETVVCEFRKVKCHDCGQIQEVVGRMEGKMTDNHAGMKKVVGKLEGSLVGINKEINKKVEEVKEMNDTVNDKVEAITNRQNEIKQEQQQVKKEVKEVKENLSKMNKDVDEVKVMMRQMLEKFNILELMNKMPSPTEKMLHTPREDILITGGNAAQNKCLKSSEIFSWEKNAWFEVSAMNDERSGASSFIHDNQIFVVGGEESKSIETLDLNKLLFKWRKFRGKLPYACDDHQTIVCQLRVFHIGGYIYDTDKFSDMISELQLTSHCSMKKVCQMPGQRQCHGAEVFKEKILVLGGETSNRYQDALDSVVEFDPQKNECKEMPPLPLPLTRMATVRWRDQVVLLGGCDEHHQALDDVFMYDSKTGKTTALPAMMEKRRDCCAVIMGNTIVVMGGMNENDERLNSVECFTMGDSTWKYLPIMNRARGGAVAEVLPSTRKYA